jgi:CheY-like chemotaxis protein
MHSSNAVDITSKGRAAVEARRSTRLVELLSTRKEAMSLENTIDTGVITLRLRALSEDSALKILVVDDDELARALLSDRLQSRGFEVTQAGDGREAMELLEEQPFPVLLVDWRMPLMDGLELTRAVRARGMLEIYVIMLTSTEDEIGYEQGYQAGVDDYLTKKVRDVELLARIHAAFTTFSLRRELRETRAELAALRARK